MPSGSVTPSPSSRTAPEQLFQLIDMLTILYAYDPLWPKRSTPKRNVLTINSCPYPCGVIYIYTFLSRPSQNLPKFARILRLRLGLPSYGGSGRRPNERAGRREATANALGCRQTSWPDPSRLARPLATTKKCVASRCRRIEFARTISSTSRRR